MPDGAQGRDIWGELAAHEGDPHTVLGLLARHVADELGDGCVLTLLDPAEGTLEPRAITHTDPSVEAAMVAVLSQGRSRVGEGVAGVVAQDRRPVVLNDLEPAVVEETTPPQFLPFVRDHPMRALAVAPLVSGGELLGTLGAVRTASGHPYTGDDLETLVDLADRAAEILDRALAPPPLVGPADYEATFRQSRDGILLTAPDGSILAANPAACGLLGRSERAILRAGRDDILDLDDPHTQAGLASRARSGHVRGEYRMRRGDDSWFVADLSSTIFTTPSGDVRASVFFRDITDEVEARERRWAQLEARARHDPLTGLLNRQGFLVAAEQALAIVDRDGADAHVLFLDVDGLKPLNDELGHRAGDDALARLGSSISDSVRQADVACRYGGDEFVMLLVGSDATTVGDVVTRIRRRQRAQCTETDPCLSFSVGEVPRAPGDGRTLSELIDAADAAMYRDKVLRRLRRR